MYHKLCFPSLENQRSQNKSKMKNDEAVDRLNFFLQNIAF